MHPIHVLLLTGTNNHDWARSAPYLKDLLERSGRFAVDLVTDPATVLEDAQALQVYDLLFVDYCGDAWDDVACANFAAAIRGGMGLVLLHGSTVGFRDWPGAEFERIATLCWRDGTGHGAYHEFTVSITDYDHPITRGIGDFTTWDELYHRMVHTPGTDYRVLATAYSAPETRGTGNHEPMMIVSQYGQGRVFYQILGHVWSGDPDAWQQGTGMASLENAEFQRTLLRGCEWAATGEVTLP